MIRTFESLRKAMRQAEPEYTLNVSLKSYFFFVVDEDEGDDGGDGRITYDDEDDEDVSYLVNEFKNAVI
jgi:hypothetical protein